MTDPAQFRTFAGRDRPHLFTEMVRAIEWLSDNGVTVHPSEVAVLTMLCDAVSASHGQFYGSWDRLIGRFPWSRSFWFKWLRELEGHGLVMSLGRLPGRKTTTTQVLPHVYRLVSTDTDTSGLVSTDTDTSDLRAVSTGVDSDSPRVWTPLVSTVEDATSVHGGGHEHHEHPEHLKGNTDLHRGFAAEAVCNHEWKFNSTSRYCVAGCGTIVELFEDSGHAS